MVPNQARICTTATATTAKDDNDHHHKSPSSCKVERRPEEEQTHGHTLAVFLHGIAEEMIRARVANCRSVVVGENEEKLDRPWMALPALQDGWDSKKPQG